MREPHGEKLRKIGEIGTLTGLVCHFATREISGILKFLEEVSYRRSRCAFALKIRWLNKVELNIHEIDIGTSYYTPMYHLIHLIHGHNQNVV